MPGREEIRGDRLEHLTVGLVLALPLLVLHDAALLVEPLLVDDAEQVPHAIGLEPQREIHGGARHRLEIIRAIDIRRAVHARGADFLQRPKILVVVVLAAVEHQMLEQVREAGLAGNFVLRADVIPDRDCDDRGLAVLVHDYTQAVIQIEFVERDLGILGYGRSRETGREASDGE